MKLLICLMPLVAIGAVRAQATWYVDAHGSAPGSGTALDPFTSIEYAIHAPTTADHDTILVRPGVYVGLVRLDRPIVVLSTDGPLATQIRGDDTVVEIGDWFSAPWEERLAGFTLERTGAGAGRVVRMIDGRIERCIVIGNSVADGVYFEDAGTLDHCVVTSCHRGLTEQPLYIYGGVVTNSIVWGNQLDASIGLGWIIYSVVGTASFPNIVLGPGVLRVPPGCFDMRRNDFHLLANSVCIDAGNPLSPPDPDGSVGDIGALAFDANYSPFEIYCTAKTNSLGCVPAISALGSASFSSSLSFEITCTNELNQRPGLLFYGFAPASAAYQGGYLCVQPPYRRTVVLDSGGNHGSDDCSGVYTFDFNAQIRSGADAQLEPGREVCAQFWSRDSAASYTTNRSDAIRFPIAP